MRLWALATNWTGVELQLHVTINHSIVFQFILKKCNHFTIIYHFSVFTCGFISVCQWFIWTADSVSAAPNVCFGVVKCSTTMFRAVHLPLRSCRTLRNLSPVVFSSDLLVNLRCSCHMSASKQPQTDLGFCAGAAVTTDVTDHNSGHVWRDVTMTGKVTSL